MASKPTFDPRRARPNQAFSYVDAGGKEHTFRADEEGVVRPSNAAEKSVADSFALPVARSIKAAEKSAGDGEKES